MNGSLQLNPLFGATPLAPLVSRAFELFGTGDVFIPCLHEEGPMGSAAYIGPGLRGGPIFVSVSQLDAKVHPGKLSTGSS
jgi:hypothetical protein